MKIFFNVVLIIIFLGGIYYISAGYNFKTYAIIVDNTDAPAGTGTIKAINVNTSEEHIFTIENGSSANFNLAEGTYNIIACVYPETAVLNGIIVMGDIDVKLEYSTGTCPF